MSRIFSFFTQKNGKIMPYEKRYRFIGKPLYAAWKNQYDKFIDDVSSGKNIYVEVSKTSSSKHGWVGKIKDATELPVLTNLDQVKLSATFQNIHYGDYKVTVDFGTKTSSVPINWLISTKKKECITYKPSERPNKLDMLGTETTVNSYVIYRYDKEIIMGYIVSISPKNKTLYCVAFDGTKRKRIDNPEMDLIVVNEKTNMYSLMSKKKLLMS